MVLDCDGRNETVRSRGRYPAFSETPGKVPGGVPPIGAEWKAGHRRKPLEKAGGLLGLGQTCHQFKENPLCDGCLCVEDEGLESSLDLGMPRWTKRVDPDGGVNQIHEGSVYGAGNEAGQV